MVRQGSRWMVPMVLLAGVVLAYSAGCRQMGEFVGGVRARQRERTLEAQSPVFDSMPGEVEVARPATLPPKARLRPRGSAIPKEAPRTREHPRGSAIPKTVEPTPPTMDDKGVGQSADNPYRNPGAEEWKKLPRHNGKLVKWRSLDVRGRKIKIKGIPAPVVKSILFCWGDGTSSRRMPPAGHTYAKGGFYRIDIVIEDILGKDFRDGSTIEIKDASGAATEGGSASDAPQSGSGPAPPSEETQQGVSGP